MSRPQYSPYVYLLFYSKYNPDLYQRQVVRYAPTSDGFVDVREFGRFQFRPIDWEKDVKEDAVLVAWTKEVPSGLKSNYKTEEITLPNGESMFTVLINK